VKCLNSGGNVGLCVAGGSQINPGKSVCKKYVESLGAQVGVLKKRNNMCLGSGLERKDGAALEAYLLFHFELALLA
jgi:hypothetical protein